MQCSSQISVFMRSDEKKQPPRQKTFLNTSIRTKQKPVVTKRGFLHEFKWFEISNRDMEVLSRKAFNDFLHVHLLHAEKLPSLLFRFNWCRLNHYVKIRHWMPCPRESSIKAKMISSVSSAFSVHRKHVWNEFRTERKAGQRGLWNFGRCDDGSCRLCFYARKR